MSPPRRQAERNPTLYKRLAVGAAVTEAVKTLEADLGQRHTFSKVCVIKRGVASTGETLVIEWSEDGTNWYAAPEPAPVGGSLDNAQGASYGPNAGLMVSPGSAPNMVLWAAAGPRYIRAKHTNGSNNAQTALVLELVAYDS